MFMLRNDNNTFQIKDAYLLYLLKGIYDLTFNIYY
jgi:hypothetical protein